jgi:hypothetical protein
MSFLNSKYLPGSRYEGADPFHLYAGVQKPDYSQLTVVQPSLDSVSVTNMRKAFAQPDMTAYSQGNVGGKK